MTEMPPRGPDHVFDFGPFIVELWDHQKRVRRHPDTLPKLNLYSARLWDLEWNSDAVFEWPRFLAPEADSLYEVALEVLVYASVEPEDVADPVFFKEYTEKQLEWVAARALYLKHVLLDIAYEWRPSLSGVFDIFKPKPRPEGESKPTIREAFRAAFGPPALPAPDVPALPGPEPESKLPAFARPFAIFAPKTMPREKPTKRERRPREKVPEPSFIPEDVREAAEREVEAAEIFAPLVEEMPPAPRRPIREPRPERRERFPERWKFAARPGRRVAGWTPPRPEELAQLVQKKVDVPDLLRAVEEARSSPDWIPNVEAQAALGRAGQVLLVPLTETETFTDLSRFFDIPWTVFEQYLKPARTRMEEQANERRLWDDVLTPVLDRLTQAFEMLKGDLPGWFAVDIDPNTQQHWLVYAESALRPGEIPGPPTRT